MAEHRTFAAELEVRGGDGRTIQGLAVPFNEITDLGAYREVFRKGAFARTIEQRGPGRVKLLAGHADEKLPIGRATLLREDAAGLYGEFKVSKVPVGDQALELVKDGALDSLSVGFTPVNHRWADDDVLERLEVKLHEVSVVSTPAFEGAKILAVRNHQPTVCLELIEAEWQLFIASFRR